MSSLCSTCKEFIQPLIQGSLHTFKSAPYGTLDDLKKRSVSQKCVVCALIADIVARQLNPSYMRLVENSFLPSNIPHFLLRPSVDAQGYFCDIYFDGKELGMVRCIKKNSFRRLLRSHPDDDLYREHCIPSKLIQTWLHNCQEMHGELCCALLNSSSDKYSSSCNLILVDIVEQRLVIEQPSLERRYIALSYVWGDASELQTTTGNLEKLQRPGALSPNNVRLPQTLRDAIDVISSLGERFMWVDTLCIIQDDNMNKKSYINQMDIVYHHAYLTIVAMSGHDANAGLPGVRPFTRPGQLFAEFKGTILVATPPGLRGSADTSWYEQRGWTLQERIMSKRCVYFSPQEVYYQCKTSIWHEPSRLRDLFGPRDMFEPPSMMNPVKASPLGILDNTQDTYQRLVQTYTHRHLTYPSDKFNAFRGNARSFRRQSRLSLGKERHSRWILG